MAIPGTAEEICTRFVAAFAAQHPHRLKGLYLVGSIALDDFQPGRSDVDFVAVTTDPVNLEDVVAIHAELPKRPFFDGLYVTQQELRAPRDGARGVAVIEGLPIGDSSAERHPVVWLTLARHGIVCDGPPPSDTWINADVLAAQAHSRANLLDYWKPWIEARRTCASRSGQQSPTLESVAWSVLGISRLHAMIARGAILSKSAAGLYAREVFPEHHQIINCALAERCGSPAVVPDDPVRRHRDMLAFLDVALADALAIAP